MILYHREFLIRTGRRESLWKQGFSFQKYFLFLPTTFSSSFTLIIFFFLISLSRSNYSNLICFSFPFRLNLQKAHHRYIYIPNYSTRRQRRMCYPTGYLLIASNNGHGRWVVSQPTRRPVVAREAAPGDGIGSAKKYCLCSPTGHPGSFRCRQHHANYVWRGRSVK